MAPERSLKSESKPLETRRLGCLFKIAKCYGQYRNSDASLFELPGAKKISILLCVIGKERKENIRKQSFIFFGGKNKQSCMGRLKVGGLVRIKAAVHTVWLHSARFIRYIHV